MTRTTYECEGCRARLESADDLERDQGTVGANWRCQYCGTTLSGVVAEKIKHQE